MSDLKQRLRTPMCVTIAACAPELGYYDEEREEAADRIEELEAEVARLKRYGDPEFFVTKKHLAESAVAKMDADAGELRGKLQETLRRANAAEARASVEQKRREAAEAKLATDRNDALEEAAHAVHQALVRNPRNDSARGLAKDAIRALKSTNHT